MGVVRIPDMPESDYPSLRISSHRLTRLDGVVSSPIESKKIVLSDGERRPRSMREIKDGSSSVSNANASWDLFWSSRSSRSAFPNARSRSFFCVCSTALLCSIRRRQEISRQILADYEPQVGRL